MEYNSTSPPSTSQGRTSISLSRTQRLSQSLLSPLNVALAEKVPIPSNDKESARWLRQQGFLEPRNRNGGGLLSSSVVVSSTAPPMPTTNTNTPTPPTTNNNTTTNAANNSHSITVSTMDNSSGPLSLLPYNTDTLSLHQQLPPTTRSTSLSSSSSSTVPLLRRVRPPAPLKVRMALQNSLQPSSTVHSPLASSLVPLLPTVAVHSSSGSTSSSSLVGSLSSSTTLPLVVVSLSKPSSPLSYTQSSMIMNNNSRNFRPSNPFASVKSAPLYRYSIMHNRNVYRGSINSSTSQRSSFDPRRENTLSLLPSSSSSSSSTSSKMAEGYSIFEENRFTVLASTHKDRGTSIYAVFDNHKNKVIRTNTNIANTSHQWGNSSLDMLVDNADKPEVKASVSSSLSSSPTVLGKRSNSTLFLENNRDNHNYRSFNGLDITNLHVRFVYQLGNEWDIQNISQSITNAWNTAIQEISSSGIDPPTNDNNINEYSAENYTGPHSSVMGVLSKSKFWIIHLGMFTVSTEDYCRAYFVQTNGTILPITDSFRTLEMPFMVGNQNPNNEGEGNSSSSSVIPEIKCTEIPLPDTTNEKTNYSFLILTTTSIPFLPSSLLLSHTKVRTITATTLTTYSNPQQLRENNHRNLTTSSNGSLVSLSPKPLPSQQDVSLINPGTTNDKVLMNIDARTIADTVLHYEPVPFESPSSFSGQSLTEDISNADSSLLLHSPKRSKWISNQNTHSSLTDITEGLKSEEIHTVITPTTTIHTTNHSSRGNCGGGDGGGGSVLVVDLRYPANIF